MDAGTSTAAQKTVETINGLPAPAALAVTIAMCVAGLAYVIYMIGVESKKNRKTVAKTK